MPGFGKSGTSRMSALSESMRGTSIVALVRETEPRPPGSATDVWLKTLQSWQAKAATHGFDRVEQAFSPAIQFLIRRLHHLWWAALQTTRKAPTPSRSRLSYEIPHSRAASVSDRCLFSIFPNRDSLAPSIC